MIFKLVAIVSLIIAGLCVLLILPWALGVPGQIPSGQNQYVEGWSLGLAVIGLYPISIVLVHSFNLITWILSFYNKLDRFNLTRCQHISTVVIIVFTVMASIQMIRAFRMMFSN